MENGMSATPFARLAELGEQLEATSKRGELAALLAAFLRELAPEELPAAVRLTIGRVFPEWDERTLNVSWKALMGIVDGLVEAGPDAREAASAGAVDGGQYVQRLLAAGRREPPGLPPLTIAEVFHAFEEIAATEGRGSRGRKEALLESVFRRATDLEAKVLAKIIYQDMRHGVSEGIMLDGIALAAGVPNRLVRRANQVWGDLGEVALAALGEGEAGLKHAGVRLFRPLKPMLAQTAETLDEAFGRYGQGLALEHKLDGARVQIHRQGDEVRIYSRHLADVTGSLPDIADEVRQRLAAQEAVLDGEAVAVDAAGRPLPFQHLMRRFRRKHALADTIASIPVRLHLFDALYVDGRPLIDRTYEERWAALEQAAGDLSLVPRLIPASPDEGQAFAEAARVQGHEGLMAKELGSSYNPGVRGKSWLKLKHVLSLDLAIVAAEWGYGRRHGWLSNYHLAARDEASGDYLVVGKTFKGLTDLQFREMTELLLSLERSRRGNVVFVRPSVVVEVLFNEVQESGLYPSGLALRFARIAHLREDKPVEEVDSIGTLRRLHEQQFEFKGRLKAG
jgi:DNA ligase 1